EAPAHRDGARSRPGAARATRAAAAADVERRANEVAKMRRELEMRVAALAERWAVLTRRLEGVDARLSSRDASEQAVAEARRASLAPRGRAYGGVEQRLTSSLAPGDALPHPVREPPPRQSEA